MVNTYGLQIKGIKKASGDTRDYGCYSGSYVEVFYSAETGEVWTVYQYSLGQNTYTVYDDAAVVKICNTSRHMTMQEIADAIYERVSMMRNCG